MSRTYEALQLAGHGLLSADTGASRSAPRLTDSFEHRLMASRQDLAMAEGNLLGASKEAKTLYVTSCLDGEGKTTAAIELAYALTLNRSARVLLVDGNSRAPQLHALFNTSIGPGLTDFLYGEASLDQVARPTAYEQLSLMTLGSAGLDRVGLFADERHLERLTAMKERFGFLVFDGNSMMGASDTALVARHFEGVVIVVECETTKREVVQVVRNKLESVGARPLGVVLNRRKLYIPRFLYGWR